MNYFSKQKKVTRKRLAPETSTKEWEQKIQWEMNAKRIWL